MYSWGISHYLHVCGRWREHTSNSYPSPSSSIVALFSSSPGNVLLLTDLKCSQLGWHIAGWVVRETLIFSWYRRYLFLNPLISLFEGVSYCTCYLFYIGVCFFFSSHLSKMRCYQSNLWEAEASTRAGHILNVSENILHKSTCFWENTAFAVVAKLALYCLVAHFPGISFQQFPLPMCCILRLWDHIEWALW